jgi:hypothetical protein
MDPSWRIGVAIAFLCGTCVLCGCAEVFLAPFALRQALSHPSELHRAAERGDLPVIEEWIASGRNLDQPYDVPDGMEAPGEHGITALMFAVKRGPLDAVQLLVEGGADLYAETSKQGRPEYGKNAFDIGVQRNRVDAAVYLEQVGQGQVSKAGGRRPDVGLFQRLRPAGSGGAADDRFPARQRG